MYAKHMSMDRNKNYRKNKTLKNFFTTNLKLLKRVVVDVDVTWTHLYAVYGDNKKAIGK